jgi:pyruvate/2-oxoglutarate dehydrogenase complex dihydrolipoamide acyltransferase (E2) component
MKVTYVGPYEGVDVALPDGSAIYAERDKPIDLRPELAKGLLIQEDIWVDPTASKDQKPPAPSKAVQKAAEELGVNLDLVEGTGSKGAIKVDDVKAAAEAAEAAQTGAVQRPADDNNSADGATEEE